MYDNLCSKFHWKQATGTQGIEQKTQFDDRMTKEHTEYSIPHPGGGKGRKIRRILATTVSKTQGTV